MSNDYEPPTLPPRHVTNGAHPRFAPPEGAFLELHPFEAHVAALFNGRRPISEVAVRAGIQATEVKAVVNWLVDKGYVQLPPPPSAAPSAPARAPTALDTPLAAGNTAQTLLQRASYLESKGRLDAAMRLLEWGLEEVPRPAALYARLAVLVSMQGRNFTRAEALLAQARRLEPDNAAHDDALMKVLILEALEARRLEELGRG